MASFAAFEQVTKTLPGKASYCKGARIEAAPNFVDCLTLVHYIFRRTLHIDIPLTFIGNMPRQLSSLREWKLLPVETNDLHSGDVLFVKNKRKRKLLSHAALALSSDRVIHCTPISGTAQIQSLEEFFEKYEQKLGWEEALRYIDPRDLQLRQQYKGRFIPCK